METQSVLVVPAGEEMELKVYVSCQWPALVQVRSFECQVHQDGFTHDCKRGFPDARLKWQRR